MQGEQAMIRADDRDDVEGFDNLQTEAEVAEFEAWLDGFEVVPVEYGPRGMDTLPPGGGRCGGSHPQRGYRF